MTVRRPLGLKAIELFSSAKGSPFLGHTLLPLVLLTCERFLFFQPFAGSTVRTLQLTH